MFEKFKTRSLELERLDTGDYTAAEYQRWQKEMWFIHRIFGEMRALRRTLFRDLVNDGSKTFSILDVGAGEGELLMALGKWSDKYEIFRVGVEIDAVAAKGIKRKSISAVRADALKLPFADSIFDYVFCTLFLHHMGDDDAVRLLKEMARVAAKRIYAVDLNRHPTAYYTYRILGRMFLQRFTLDDGSLSILRSYTPPELFELAERAGLTDVKLEHSRANRLVLSARTK